MQIVECNNFSVPCYGVTINWRMHNSKSVLLQTKKDLFQPEIWPNSFHYYHFSTFFRTLKSSKTFGIHQLKYS